MTGVQTCALPIYGQNYEAADGGHGDDPESGKDTSRSASATGHIEPDTELEKLRHELEAAIAEENYERAALLRDKLKLL